MLDPSALAGLPAVVADAVRQGLADQLHEVFLLALPLVLVVLLATMAIRPLPLRETVHTDAPLAEEAGHEVLDAMAQSSAEGTRDDAESAGTASGRSTSGRSTSGRSASGGTASDGVHRDRRHVGG